MIRNTVHAGTFYPRFAHQLLAMFDKWQEDVLPVIPSERNIGILVPHAGFIYSGRLAYLGMASVAYESFDSIIILHPSHQGIHFDYSVSPYSIYETPLGNLELDEDLYRLFSPHASQDIALDYHALEHSLEIQLPLLYHFFPHARICPILLGNQNPVVSERIAEALYEVVYKSSKRILILASSDLSHYHAASKAEAMDKKVLEHFQKLDAEALYRDASFGKLEACGLGTILSLVYYSQKYSSVQSRIIEYTHSGTISGHNSQVVGYLAAKIYV
ncbi:MAG: AmmeMemoRadiSam system protein B [Candidatus Cloacimonetes bacterium]|nr:AmmeMemoRadiSam system protein B [Candidatus Cloacimonadota bacterium]